MSNGKNGQTSFALQTPPPKVYRVGAGQLFSTVQSAIDQAVTDGATSNDSPAIVEISAGTYTENLSLKPGVSLQGCGNYSVGPGGLNSNGTGGIVTVVGNHTYAVSNGLNRAQNSINVAGVNLTCLNGVLMTVSGTSQCQITFSGMTLQKQTGGDNNPVLQATNSGSNTRIRFQNGASIDNNVASNPLVVDIQQAVTLEFRDRTSSIFSSGGVTAAIGLRLSNTSQLRVTNVDGFFNGAYSTACIEIATSTVTINLQWTQLSNTYNAGSSCLISYNAAAAANSVRLRWCQLQVSSATSYLAKNTSGNGGSWQQGSNVIIGTAGGTSTNVQNGITISTDTSNATNAA